MLEYDAVQHSEAVVSTVASYREGCRFNSEPALSGVKFACSPSVCVGSHHSLKLIATVQRHVHHEWMVVCLSIDIHKMDSQTDF